MSENTASVHDRFPGTGTVVLCFDGPQGESARAAATAAHLKYVESIFDEINIAGPMYDPSGVRTIGSLYVLKTKSAVRAHEIIENDPYFKAGAFEKVSYQPFLPAAGHYIGGKIW
jgi:uncharacterized protein